MWESIEIAFTSQFQFQVFRGEKPAETKTIKEIGLEDGRTDNPKKAWFMLLHLARNNGVIRHGGEVGEKWPKVEKRIQEIRRAFKNYFGLAGDPIPYVKGLGYRARFKIRSFSEFSPAETKRSSN